MITADIAIKMTEEEEVQNLPKSERKKAIKTRESYQKFVESVEKIKALNIDKDIEITVTKVSPAGMIELPQSTFNYSSKKGIYISKW